MKFPHKRLLLAAALGLPATFAGCHSRAELVTSAAVDSPTRTLAEEASQADAPGEPAGDEEVNSAAKPEKPAGDPQEVSLTDPAAPTPRALLENAGAVIEFDEQQRAVGIDLTEARITPEITRSIAELTDLQWADLRGTRATDADLAVICAVPQFELIALGQTRITDAGLVHLRQQHKLRFLSLDGTVVTDAGLTTLAGLPRLEGLSLAKTSVSRSAAREFEKRNPGCRVILDDDAPETSSPQSPAGDAPPAIDWATPAPAAEQKPTETDSATEPAPGEPTSAAPRESTWFLDDAQPTVFPQPLPQPAVERADSPLAVGPGPAEPLPATLTPQPIGEAPAQIGAQPIQITPVTPTPAADQPVSVQPSRADETAQHLHHVLQQRLLDPEVLTALSRHLLAQQQYAKAVRALEALAALTPDDPQVRFDLGVALARTGEYELAHPQLARVVGEATAYYNLGIIAFERQEPQHSERFFGRAIDLAPDFREARDWLARVRETSSRPGPNDAAPASVDSQDLVDLLMSEFGTAAAASPGTPAASPATPATSSQSAAGITIVPNR